LDEDYVSSKKKKRAFHYYYHRLLTNLLVTSVVRVLVPISRSHCYQVCSSYSTSSSPSCSLAPLG
jgi:hypothetical protein